MTFAGSYRYLTGLGCLLAGISAVVGLFPYLYMWSAIKTAVCSWPVADAQALILCGWKAVASALGSMALYFLALLCTHFAAFRTARNLKSRAMHRLMELPIGTIRQIGSGKIRRIVDDGAAQTETYLAHQLPDLTGAFVTPIAVLILLLFFDWRFGLISLIPMGIGAVCLSRMAGPKLKEKMDQYQDALGDMNNEAVEYVRGIPVVKTFQQSVFSFKNFHEAILRFRDWSVSYTISLRLPMCGYTTAIHSAFLFLIVAGVLLVGDLSSGQQAVDTALDLVFYLLFTPVCVTMMDKIMHSSENTMLAKDAIERILAIMRKEELLKPKHPKTPEDTAVEFDDVSFSYRKDGKNALEHVSFRIEPGTCTVLVGESGGGKSTVASLIPRFFDVDQGRILIGGVDVREMDTEELMRQVSFVFQDSHLFKATLLENIRAGRPDASREEVMQVALEAQCRDIIEKMPQGLDTVVGEKGVYLSGGECQRIALARALLKDAPIVVLDEATAFADPDNEALIQKAFEKLIRKKTVLMIAHRLSTVCGADQVLVMRAGTIAECGTHRKLLEQNGIYSKMWADYQAAAEWKVGERNA
ncbi:ABC transporter ATP-binding protein [Brotaphodocola sp.]|uniref:ABC transporter ATP-binding protein n=1 Tax=Brotaphodocola sp. TaxID=3073577 RepID=UPI003D7CE8EC